MLTLTPKLDPLLLPTEQVLFRASRGIRTTIWWGVTAFVAASAGSWAIAENYAGTYWAFVGIGAFAVLIATILRPSAQIIVTDSRLLIRYGPFPTSVTSLSTIAGVERSVQGKIELIWHDGDSFDVGAFPSLAEFIAVLVEQTGIGSPVFLPKKLWIWSILTKTAHAVGAFGGFVMNWLVIAFICQAIFVDSRWETVGDTVFFIAFLTLLLPAALFGMFVGLAIAVAILRLALSATELRLIFDAGYSLPNSLGPFERRLESVVFLPARYARRLASMLYGEEV